MMSKDNAQLCAFHSVWKSPTEYFASLGECTATVMDVLLVAKCRECEESICINYVWIYIN